MASCLFFLVFLALIGCAEGAVGEDCSTNACSDDTTVCESDACKTKAEGTCSAAGDCVSHATCTGTTKKCTCDDGYTASSDICKMKAGGTCAATSECVPQSTCLSTKCTCTDGYSAAATGLCSAIDQGKVNAACETTSKPCKGTNVECTDNFCKCKEGFSGDKGDDDCSSNKGVALGQVSLWTLCMTILTVSLAVNVV